MKSCARPSPLYHSASDEKLVGGGGNKTNPKNTYIFGPTPIDGTDNGWQWRQTSHVNIWVYVKLMVGVCLFTAVVENSRPQLPAAMPEVCYIFIHTGYRNKLQHPSFI